MALTKSARVLVIEDNPKMAEAVKAILSEGDFQVETCMRAVEGEALALAGGFQMILMDVLLPDGDGVQVCKRLRGAGVKTPIILLTALGDTNEKIDGLDVGADDYVCKPFNGPELLARMNAILRRTGAAVASTTLSCDDLLLDVHARTLTRGGKTHQMHSREFDLMHYMMRNQNRVISRADIHDRVWGMELDASSNVIDVYISSLRKMAHVPGLRPLIHTVKGSGYRLGVME